MEATESNARHTFPDWTWAPFPTNPPYYRGDGPPDVFPIFVTILMVVIGIGMFTVFIMRCRSAGKFEWKTLKYKLNLIRKFSTS